jgi:hypothetical protein
MRLPESLPDRLFLLAVDPRRQRLADQTYLCYTLRAAALTDLLLRKLVADEGGKVRVTGQMRVGDPLLDAMLAAVAEDRPRTWEAWVRRRRRGHKTRVDVREQLATVGWITAEPGRILGIFPTVKITVLDPSSVERLRERLVLALDGGQVDEHERALLALAAAGNMSTVLSWRQRRTHRKRIAELTALVGPPVPALRKAIQHAQAAAAAAGG